MAVRVDPWHPPPSTLVIHDEEVHVWRARLYYQPSGLQYFETLLSRDEISRARRFRFPIHRNSFVSCRGILRLLLSRYLQTTPENINLELSEYGKPFLAQHHATNIRFNLSHSDDLALFALTRGRSIGVDLECIKPAIVEDSVPEQFFSPREVAVLRKIPRQHQPAAFFECWVRKEAYVKARGMGLSLALDSFEVSLGADEPARLLSTFPDPQDAERWTIQSLSPAPGYAAALVVEGHGWIPQYWNWPDHAPQSYLPVLGR